MFYSQKVHEIPKFPKICMQVGLRRLDLGGYSKAYEPCSLSSFSLDHDNKIKIKLLPRFQQTDGTDLEKSDSF